MNAIAKAVIDGIERMIDRTEEISRADRMFQVCTNCGRFYGAHSAIEEECPHPNAAEPGYPFYIAGQTFSLVPHRCEALLVRHSEDADGEPCGKRCEPGKNLCQEHYEE